MTLLSLLLVGYSARYFSLNPAVFSELQRAAYVRHEVPLGLHICGAIVTLALGPWQFSRRLRRRWPRWHRRIGVLYLLGCLVGGVGALLLAPIAYGGVVTSLGFAALAVTWLVTGGLALLRIRQGRVAEHRRWMIRSFALTFAAVTFRLVLAVAGALAAAGLVHVDFRAVYMTDAWLSWLLNLLVAWWFTRPVRRAAR